MKPRKNRYLRGTIIVTAPITGNITVTALVDRHFQAYNAGRLREACQLFAGRMLDPDVTIGMSISGALTPAGLGGSCIVPLIESGFVDWIVSTGANFYHDTHFAIGKKMHRGSPFIEDRLLRDEGVIRIYDIPFSYDVLLDSTIAMPVIVSYALSKRRPRRLRRLFDRRVELVESLRREYEGVPKKEHSHYISKEGHR